MRALRSLSCVLLAIIVIISGLFATNTPSHKVWERHRHFQGRSTLHCRPPHAPELTAVVHLLVLHSEDVPEPAAHDFHHAEDQLEHIRVHHARQRHLRHPPEAQHHVVDDGDVVLVRVGEQVSRPLLRVVAQQIPLSLLEVVEESCFSFFASSPTPVLAQVPVQRVEGVQQLENAVASVAPEETHRDHAHKVLDAVGEVGVAFPGGE